MGLRTSHDAFYGAYTAFWRFRNAVAEACGGGSYPPHIDKPGLDQKRWYAPDGEDYPALQILFNHDDDRGEISPEDAASIADDLEKLLPKLDAMGNDCGHIEADGGFGGVARRFIAGCRLASKRGEPILFG